MTIRGRLLFISALLQCGDYSRAATIRSTDVISATAMRRLFEGGYYSKYRCRSYYLFQRYHNAATIRGWLLFLSALPQCGDYSKYRCRGCYLFQLYRNAATIRGGATIRSTDVAATISFSATAMRRLFEGGYYFFQLYHNAATIRGRLLFEVQMSRLLFISALPQCSIYSKAATIRSTDVAATIYFSSTAMRRLFEGGYYSKYRRRGYYLFQRYRNAASTYSREAFNSVTGTHE